MTAEGRLLLRDVDWATYEDLLEQFEDSHVFMTYDHGRLEITSPSYRHDRSKSLIARLIEVMVFEMNIEVEPCGSVTLRRESISFGLEPDECYYIANFEQIWEFKDELDLEKLPSPDLAVEVEVTHSSVGRLPVYAGLGVPEIWRYDRKTRSIRFLHLTGEGEYVELEASKAFPFLTSHDFQRFLNMQGKVKPNRLIRQFQDWLQQRKK